MPASRIASNYPLNEQWASLAVYGKKALLRRKLQDQHKLTRKAKLWKRTVGNGKRRTRGLCLSPRALANWFQSLTSNSDCCYHRLSVATSLRSYSYQRPLAGKAADWICKFSAREEWFMRTSQHSLTGSHRCWSYLEQAGTNGTPT